jgi:hypothetical protein
MVFNSTVTWLIIQAVLICSSPSFPSALQLRVSFGLLNNQPPFLSILHCSDDEMSNGGMKKWMEEVVAHLFSG